MFRLCHNVEIGRYRLKLFSDVLVKRSVESLSDTATITVPGRHLNRPLSLQGKINRGDRVLIELGYDDRLRREFSGYVEKITDHDGTLKIECLDELYLFKQKSLENVEHKGITLTDLLKLLCAAVDPSIQVQCDYEFGYEKFVFLHATAYDVLKKIQEETRADIFFDDGTLHVHAPYTWIANDQAVRFDPARNIEKCDLRWVDNADKKVRVEVKVRMPNGKEDKVEKGLEGGETVNIISASSNLDDANRLAAAEYARRVGTGYEGNFTCWLMPYVAPAYKVSLHDDDRELRDGVYYVTAAEVNFGSTGGSRKITLGRRLS